jgi:predicted pyridoxine 5'-phosphate oxidase superfamily flavin-nucleotide-binding protein
VVELAMTNNQETMQPSPKWDSPYHAGEQAMQERAGWRARSEEGGRRMIRTYMPDQHRDLFTRLPLLFVGSVDAQGRPWASVLSGPPGFIASPDAQTLTVTAKPIAGDPLAANIADGAPIGLIGIQLETRRRNRMNGWLTDVHPGGFSVRVGQSFGNCPQYIQARQPTPYEMAAPLAPVSHEESALLSARARTMASSADTFFIATAAVDVQAGDPVQGIDVSHRGGKPGFVRVESRDGVTELTAPDFRGNFSFNTFGNIAVNPRAGLLFIDFDRGDLLSLTGEARVEWEGPEIEAFAGAQRLLRFRVHHGVLIEKGLPLRWSRPLAPPQLAATGSWDAIPSVGDR